MWRYFYFLQLTVRWCGRRHSALGRTSGGCTTPQGTLEVWHIEIVSLASGPVSEGCLDTSDGQPTSGPTGDVDVWC